MAESQRRSDLPGGRGGREVPRRHDGHGADRLAAHVDLHPGAHRIGGVADLAQRLGRVVGEELSGTVHLATPLGERLALLARQQAPELLGARHQLVADRHQHRLAALDAGARPLGLRDACRRQRLVELRGRGLRVGADQVAQVGRVAVLDRGVARHPSTRYQVPFHFTHGVSPSLVECRVARARLPIPAVPRQYGHAPGFRSKRKF